MSTDNLTHHDLIHRAVIAQAAILAAGYAGDEFKGDLAEEELDRLSRIDFSATNAGTHFVNGLIHEAFEMEQTSYPFRSEQKIVNLWTTKLDELLGSARSLAEAEAVIANLRVAHSGYTIYMYSLRGQRRSRRRDVLKRLLPTSLAISVSAAFFKVSAKWKRCRDGGGPY